LVVTLFYAFCLAKSYLFEERVGNLGWTLAPESELEERIVIVAIDERSIAAVRSMALVKRKMAQLTSSIDAAGAQLQLHDVVYIEPKVGRRQLRASLCSVSGVVILKFQCSSENSSDLKTMQNIQTGLMTHPVVGISCNEGLIWFGSAFLVRAVTLHRMRALLAVAKGHIAPLVNSDGSISKQPAIVCVEGLPYPRWR
jgi:hypothetical protein